MRNKLSNYSLDWVHVRVPWRLDLLDLSLSEVDPPGLVGGHQGGEAGEGEEEQLVHVDGMVVSEIVRNCKGTRAFYPKKVHRAI